MMEIWKDMHDFDLLGNDVSKQSLVFLAAYIRLAIRDDGNLKYFNMTMIYFERWF